MDSAEPVAVSNRGGVAIVTLNRPEVHNAVNEPMRTHLAGALSKAAADPDIGVVVLTGAGTRAFCAGMDLHEFAGVPMSVAARRRQRRERAVPLADFPKPTIAAVNGLAFGLGLELVLQCDIVVAAVSASFALTEVRRGLIPGSGGTVRLARRVGQGRALEMILTGRRINSDEAIRYGLVEYVVPDDQLLEKAESMSREILACAPVAVQLARDSVRRAMDLPLSEGLRIEGDLVAIAMGTEDAQEGPRAFAEKRAPRWRGA